MNTNTLLLRCPGRSLLAALAALLLVGCHSAKTTTSAPTPAAATASTQPAPATAAAAPSVATEAKAAPGVVRIRMGDAGSFTDAGGNVWLGDRGFADGDTISRDPELKIENTKDPELYRFEHYSMTSFSYPLPNGKYAVKLHFAETFDGITGPGQRVFSFELGGKQFKDFDVWVKAGGAQKAYVETVNVEVSNGKLEIKFTPQVENPEINGIEIFPL